MRHAVATDGRTEEAVIPANAGMTKEELEHPQDL
jgi:hypothetical protein